MAKKKNSRKLDELQVSLLDDKDFLKGIIETFCQRLLEEEITHHLGAETYQRTEKRKGYRNGYKPRRLKTRVGKLELLVPQDREGEFQTELFRRYQRSEKALVLSLIEMYINGVSTRKVTDITERLFGTSFSKSQVSDLSKGLDEEIAAWRNRPLEKKYPYVIADARYEKVRKNGKIVSQGVLIVLGVDEDGYREILSVDIANTETEQSWSRVFRNLTERGLKGVKLLVSDDHKGLRSALVRYFQGVMWQRCQFHFLHNLLDLVPKKKRKEITLEIRSIFDSPDLYFANLRVRELVEKYQDLYPEFTQKLEEEIEETLCCFHFPPSHRKRIRTTNSLERFNEEIRRRTRVIRIFPNEESCIRLVSALAIEQSEEWLTGKRYLNMEKLYEGENQILKVEEPQGYLAVAK